MCRWDAVTATRFGFRRLRHHQHTNKHTPTAQHLLSQPKRRDDVHIVSTQRTRRTLPMDTTDEHNNPEHDRWTQPTDTTDGHNQQTQPTNSTNELDHRTPTTEHQPPNTNNRTQTTGHNQQQHPPGHIPRQQTATITTATSSTPARM